MGSPKQQAQPYIPPPAPVVPQDDTAAQDAADEASKKARRARSYAGGYRSTILTSGLGVVEQAATRSNTLG